MIPAGANEDITGNEPYDPAEAQNYLVGRTTGSGDVLSMS